MLLALLLAATTEYVVQPGDTCVAVARKIWGDPKAVDKFHALNDLGPPPHHLVPGRKLLVEDIADARLTFVRPDVNHKRRGVSEWAPAAQGQDLHRLDQVNTLAGAGAEVTFPDQTRLQIRDSALVVIYGKETTRSAAEARSGEFELVQGELRMSLAALRGDKPVNLSAQGTRVSARSRDLLVGVDAQKMSRVSLYDGRAEVSAAGKLVRVPQGSGTRVAYGKPPEPPRPLPLAPQWAEVPKLVLGPASIAWKAVARGASYQLLVARDAAFLDVVARANGAETTARLEALPPGEYLLRVAARDDAGLEGYPSEARKLVVARLALEAVPGDVRVTLEGPAQLAVDGAEATSPVRLRAPGTHAIVVRAGEASEPQQVEVAAPRAESSLVPQGGALALRVALTPPSTEALELDAGGAAVSAESRSGGVLTALLTPPTGTRSAHARLRWAGVQIGELDAELPAPPPPPKPPPAPEPVQFVDLVGEPDLVAEEPLPLASRGLQGYARLQLADLRSKLGAGFDAGTEAFRAGVEASGVLTAAGDARVRYFAVHAAFTVLPTLDVGLSVASPLEQESRDGLRARVHAAAGRTLAGVEVRTTQALALGFGHGVRAEWESAYAAGVRLRPWLLVGVQVDALAGALPFAPAAGGGVRARLGAFEAGLSLRGGLTDDGRAAWGHFGALLSVSYGLTP